MNVPGAVVDITIYLGDGIQTQTQESNRTPPFTSCFLRRGHASGGTCVVGDDAIPFLPCFHASIWHDLDLSQRRRKDLVAKRVPSG